MSQMVAEEIESYLAEARIADLVTLRNDGFPHVAPVWYQFRSGTLFVMAHTSSLKVRNIRNDSRVAISIAKQDHPYQYVVVEGTARIIEQTNPDMIKDISIHYRGPEDGAKFASELLEEGGTVTIEILPTRTITWVDES